MVGPAIPKDIQLERDIRLHRNLNENETVKLEETNKDNKTKISKLFDSSRSLTEEVKHEMLKNSKTIRDRFE